MLIVDLKAVAKPTSINNRLKKADKKENNWRWKQRLDCFCFRALMEVAHQLQKRWRSWHWNFLRKMRTTALKSSYISGQKRLPLLKRSIVSNRGSRTHRRSNIVDDSKGPYGEKVTLLFRLNYFHYYLFVFNTPLSFVLNFYQLVLVSNTSLWCPFHYWWQRMIKKSAMRIHGSHVSYHLDANEAFELLQSVLDFKQRRS